MQPSEIQPAGWDEISRLMVYLFLFTGLGLTAVVAFLLARGVVPSLVGTGDIPRLYLVLRWPLILVLIASAALALVALRSALGLAFDFVDFYYPRGPV